ncbi:MAG: MarC family protein [Spirochaetes bacterium]|nr:MarC family protein [Spirochaetota bacterium]
MPLIQEIVTTFLAIFIVVDPFGIVPFFISLTAGFDARRRRRTILKASLIAFVVLLVFILAGNAILRFLGIQPGSFYIAGGILLFLVSIDLLFGKPGRTKTPPQESGGTTPQLPHTEPEDVSIFPLAVPMLAGPGTITTILLYVSAGRGAAEISILTACVAVALGCAALTMSLSAAFLRVLGRTGVSVIERIMGIILAGLSVQFVYDGIVRLGLVKMSG